MQTMTLEVNGYVSANIIISNLILLTNMSTAGSVHETADLEAAN